MSIFGSREDDPLLQDDPFSPPSKESPSPDDTAAPSDEAPHSSPSTENQTDSVFSGPAQSDPAAADDAAASPADTRTLARPLNAILDGRLSELSALLDQGWQLTEVRLQECSSPEEMAATSARRLVFVLRPPPE